MQLKLSEPVSSEDTVTYGGEQFDRTPEHSYGNLLSAIDTKRKRIAYNRNVFSAERDRIPDEYEDFRYNAGRLQF